ncbi:MAG: SurA N-terminal domain-containing protein [Thermacetogeniaceae bacterium]
MSLEESGSTESEQSQQEAPEAAAALVPFGWGAWRQGWPYWPQVLVFIGILIVAGLWYWWSESGDWVVRVNGAPVSRAEWQQETSRAEVSMSRLYGIDPKAPGNEKIDQQISGEVLQQMVDEVLLRQAAARAGISATPEEVETRVLMDMMNTGGQDQLEQALSSQGYTMNQYRQLVAEMITVSKLGDYVTRNVTVTEDEVRAAYESEKSQLQNLSFADVHDQLQQQVLTRKKNDVFGAYLDGLQQSSFIELRVQPGPALK